MSVDKIRQALDGVYRAESPRIFATPVRLIGDIDPVEEVLHDAFASAIEHG